MTDHTDKNCKKNLLISAPVSPTTRSSTWSLIVFSSFADQLEDRFSVMMKRSSSVRNYCYWDSLTTFLGSRLSDVMDTWDFKGFLSQLCLPDTVNFSSSSRRWGVSDIFDSLRVSMSPLSLKPRCYRYIQREKTQRTSISALTRGFGGGGKRV